jgi:hypothetical protein
LFAASLAIEILVTGIRPEKESAAKPTAAEGLLLLAFETSITTGYRFNTGREKWLREK